MTDELNNETSIVAGRGPSAFKGTLEEAPGLYDGITEWEGVTVRHTGSTSLILDIARCRFNGTKQDVFNYSLEVEFVPIQTGIRLTEMWSSVDNTAMVF